jgi:hypothetical protein
VLKTDDKSILYEIKTTTKPRKTTLKEGFQSPAKPTTKDNVDAVEGLMKKLVKQTQVQTKGKLVAKGALRNRKKRVREEKTPKESLPKKRKTISKSPPKKSKIFSIASPSLVETSGITTRSKSKQFALSSQVSIQASPSSLLQFSLETLSQNSSQSLPLSPPQSLSSSPPQSLFSSLSHPLEIATQLANSIKKSLRSHKAQPKASTRSRSVRSQNASTSLLPSISKSLSKQTSFSSYLSKTLIFPKTKVKNTSSKRLKDLVEKMDVEESSVESMEIEVIQNFWRVDCFDFNTSLVREAFNNVGF